MVGVSATLVQRQLAQNTGTSILDQVVGVPHVCIDRFCNNS